MSPEQKVSENTEQRKIQFRNFAAMTGLDEDSMMEAARQNFVKPWDELSASQKRGRLLTGQLLQSFNKNPGNNDEYRVVAWRSLFMPTEITYAMGILPFTTEMFAAQLALSGLAGGRLETAEGSGFSPDLCSFIKTGAGAVLENILPSPDIILTTTHLCDPAAKFASYTAQKYNRPEFVLDVPYGLWSLGNNASDIRKLENAVSYVASQLEDMVEFITRETGLKLDESKLVSVIENTNAARKWLMMGNDLTLYTVPAISLGSKELNYAANLMQTWGTEEIIDVYKSRYEELQAAADSAEGDPTRPRIVWFHLRPYYRNSVLEYIEERVDIVQTQVNYVFWDELDVSDPYRAMASKMLFHPGYCPVGIRTQMIIDRMQKGDGIIAFYPKSCRHFHSSARIETEMFKKAGIPMLIIDGDCIDSRGDDFHVMKTRIDRFLKGLQSQARNDDRTISSSGI